MTLPCTKVILGTWAFRAPTTRRPRRLRHGQGQGQGACVPRWVALLREGCRETGGGTLALEKKPPRIDQDLVGFVCSWTTSVKSN